jgi:Flp pilus assembly protein TadG
MTTATPARRQGDRGTAAIELAVIAPVFLVFLLALITAGRYSVALQAGEAAAFDAARTASLSRTAAAAGPAARTAALNSYATAGIRCREVTAVVDTAGFAVPVGQPATVSVRVTCVVDLADVALPGLPGSATLTSSFTSPLDTYRSRT